MLQDRQTVHALPTQRREGDDCGTAWQRRRRRRHWLEIVAARPAHW